MNPSPLIVTLRGTGFLKQLEKVSSSPNCLLWRAKQKQNPGNKQYQLQLHISGWNEWKCDQKQETDG